MSDGAFCHDHINKYTILDLVSCNRTCGKSKYMYSISTNAKLLNLGIPLAHYADSLFTSQIPLPGFISPPQVILNLCINCKAKQISAPEACRCDYPWGGLAETDVFIDG